uniref:uncharacterized protein LOC120329693 n=1 Tax=Styela clava TaxID=7725 RepID=UPI00193AA236|nr:uncharacterized protein LOC120329693 [Styela clava]
MICILKGCGRLFCAGFFFFLLGVEFAVILPTLNEYLIYLDGPTAFFGITISAFSFTGLISSPVYGRIADKTNANKLCAIVSCLFGIVGNFLYFVGRDYRLLLGARLITGLGNGASSSYLGMVVRTTTTKQRTGVITLVVFMREIGVIIGPGFNLILSRINFKLGPFAVDQFSSPGLLLAIMWVLHTLFVLALFRDVSEDYGDKEIDINDPVQKHDDPSHKTVVLKTTSEIQKLKSFREEFFRKEILVCLLLNFSAWAAVTCFESATTPMSLLFFGWGGVSNSLMFCAGAITVCISYAVIGICNRKVTDRVILLMGCSVALVSYLILNVYSIVLFLQEAVGNVQWLLPVFWTDWIILIISFPLMNISIISLYSKITSIETQSFNQGALLMFAGAGRIVGPLLSTSMVTIERLPILSGVVLFLLLVSLIVLCFTYKKLVPVKTSTQMNDSTPDKSLNVDEKTSLLKEVD